MGHLIIVYSSKHTIKRIKPGLVNVQVRQYAVHWALVWAALTGAAQALRVTLT